MSPLAGAERADPAAAAELDAALALLVRACRCLADELAPFIPATAARVAARCTPAGPSAGLPGPEPVFPRIEARGMGLGPPAFGADFQ